MEKVFTHQDLKSLVSINLIPGFHSVLALMIIIKIPFMD